MSSNKGFCSKISRRYWLLLAGGSFVLITTLWLVFDLYQKTVAEEMLTSFLKAEAVSIQEGNLLSSVAKNQRMLLSSQFVKGIVLLDCGVQPPKQLMILGSGQQVVRCFDHLSTDSVSVMSSGFLKAFSAQEIKGQNHLQLIFHIESSFLKILFLVFSISFLTIFLGVFGFFQSLKKRELLERQRILKNAIGSFIDNDSDGALLSQELPDLKDWIVARKKELKEAQEETIQAKKQEALVEVARRIAHDIRSPLQTLGVVLENLGSLPTDKKRMAQLAVNRLYQISKGIVNTSPSDILEKSIEIEKIWVWGIIDKIVLEKRTQYQNRSIDFKVSSDLKSACAFVNGNISELTRSLSNLIDNSAEAIKESGQIEIKIELVEHFIQIKIIDNGKGIPETIINRIGERGFSSHKNGNGLGVFYAKELVKEMGGFLKVSSREGDGTEICLSFPSTDKPDWFVSEIPKARSILILDDDVLVHEKIQNVKGAEAKIFGFFEPRELRKWIRGSTGEFVLLSDFDLGKESINGMDFILTQDLASKSLILTNSYDDTGLQQRAIESGVRVFPKPLLAYMEN